MITQKLEKLNTGPPILLQKFNAMVDAVNALNNLTGDGFVQVRKTVGGVGLKLNFERMQERMPKAVVAQLQLQIFQITTVGSWGNYTCKKYVIDATHWNGSSGQTKLVKVSDDTYTIFNIAEDATTASNALAIGDVLLARQSKDDTGVLRWIGFSPKFAWWDV